MIVFGVTMRGQDDRLPKAMADWLVERNRFYPNITFSVGHLEASAQDIQWQEMAKKYSCLYLKSANMMWGITQVVFPYLIDQWFVKIIGLANEKGEILDPRSEEYSKGQPLLPAMRYEIAGVPPPETLDKSGHFLCLPRQGNEPALDKAQDLVPFVPDFRF